MTLDEILIFSLFASFCCIVVSPFALGSTAYLIKRIETRRHKSPLIVGLFLFLAEKLYKAIYLLIGGEKRLKRIKRTSIQRSDRNRLLTQSFLKRVLNLLVSFYPLSYRERFGQELLDISKAKVNDIYREQGRLWALFFLLREVKDHLNNAFAEHLDQVKQVIIPARQIETRDNNHD